jgi:hypothetical protein
MAFMPVSGLTDYVRDEYGRAIGLSILRGARVIAGDDQSYWRWWGECVAILVIGGRGICFAIMMWPSRPRRGKHFLDEVLRQPTPDYDPANGSRPR